jgi:hypothetical protein
MFGFGKRKAPPKWNDLSDKQKLMVTNKIAKGIKAQWFGPRYKLVSGTDILQRERGMVEFRTEDEILNAYGRG